MKNNAFGMLIESWADYAIKGSGHLSYPAVIRCLFPSAPSVSAASRMKSTQPVAKTLARFIAEASTTLNVEQDFLIRGRIQPKLQDNLNYLELKDFIWEVLGEYTDDTSSVVVDDNHLFNLVFDEQPPGQFKKGVVEPVLRGLDEHYGGNTSRKLRPVTNQLDDGTPYGRFDLFALLFFVSLTGERGADAVIAGGIFPSFSVPQGTPMVDRFANRPAMQDCGFVLRQLEVGPDGTAHAIKSWEFDESTGEAIIGREGPDVVLVPPSGNAWAVSRKHARVYVDSEGAYWAEDLSLNGTAVRRSGGGSELLHHSFCKISHGDELLLAPLRGATGFKPDCVENWENGSVLRFALLRRQEK
ncbi:MAG: FHA domain-containing protein [Coriobacteriia bacterium]|nr:FHA domain-containing protein [Coriobacteriia bacterium]